MPPNDKCSSNQGSKQKNICNYKNRITNKGKMGISKKVYFDKKLIIYLAY